MNRWELEGRDYKRILEWIDDTRKRGTFQNRR